LGYNIGSVHQWDPFSFNTDIIAKEFKNHDVKYVIHYSDSFGYKIITIYRFSGDENIFDKSSESEFISFNVGSGDGQINLSGFPKSLSKADRPSMQNDKATLNINSVNDNTPRSINEYPKDLDTSNLIVLKQKGNGAGMMNKKLKEIFDQYPFGKESVVYDSVIYFKKMGSRYLLTW
jgi:hypothetical protein